ncbi:MAG: MBL fold metallo-hydrolase [Chloroflexota bacterium]|nr:MBL fold metallo-hydrolase [Chloroflexota bacterium]
MRVISLGSGSSGNALVAQVGAAAVLLDAGFPLRTLLGRLRQANIAPESVGAILLTHEHHDHACGAVAFSRRYGVPLIANPATLAAVLAQPARGQAEPFDPASVERVELPLGREVTIAGLRARSFPVSHDAVAPAGYLISSGAWRLCFITDSGMVNEPMIEAMGEASLLVIESNHDRERLLRGPYPWHLKQRILSPTGHLANDQTSEALLRVLDDAPRWVWLGHLSRTNNTPDIARAHLRERLRQVGLRHIEPRIAPPSVGEVWDSATLWGQPAPARPDSAEPPTSDAATPAVQPARRQS